MNSKRLHFLLIGLIGLLLIGLVVGAYGINSLLSQRANGLMALKAKSLAQDEQKVALTKAKASIEKYSDLEKITKAIVPEDKSQAEAVSEIVRISGKYGVSLSSITFPASTLGGGAVGSAAPAQSASPNPPSTESSKKSLSQLQAVKSIPGVYELNITVTSDTSKPVPYDKFISFLSELENNRRTAQVSSITIQPDPLTPNNLTFSLVLKVYVKP